MAPKLHIVMLVLMAGQADALANTDRTHSGRYRRDLHAPGKGPGRWKGAKALLRRLLPLVGSTPGARIVTRPALRSAAARARQQSLQLDDMFARLARSNATPGARSSELWESFRICGECKVFERFGEAHDGGYLTCVDGVQQGQLSAAYSMGVERYDKWSKDVAQYFQIPVNQFDCTVPAGSDDCERCTFYKKCIVAANGKHPVPGHETEGWSLAQALAETSQADPADRSLLMKMDIESSEWPVIAAEPPATLSKFAQVIVEFHYLSNSWKHRMYLRAMQNILGAGFKVAHLHGNNYASMYTPDWWTNPAIQIPDAVEVTFVHSGARPDGCARSQIYRMQDTPNNPLRAESPLIRLP